MAPLGVDPELRLVYGSEGELLGERPFGRAIVAAGADRHRFRRGQDVARLRGDDAFFARQQSDLLLALDRDDPLVDFAGEQPQREADDAGGMAAHTLDRQMRLAGVGGPEDCPDRSV